MDLLLHFVVLSSGKIRAFQIISSLIYIIDLPITYFLFSVGLPAPTVLWVKIGTMVGVVFVRILYASIVAPCINFSNYCKKVLVPLLLTSSIAVVLAFYLNTFATSWGLRLLYTVVIELTCFALFWLWCLERTERQLLLRYFKIKK